MEEDFPLPEEFEHQLVVAEDEPDCKCNDSHAEGDAIWGGSQHPTNMPYDIRETLVDLHSVGVRYEHRKP